MENEVAAWNPSNPNPNQVTILSPTYQDLAKGDVVTGTLFGNNLTETIINQPPSGNTIDLRDAPEFASTLPSRSRRRWNLTRHCRTMIGP